MNKPFILGPCTLYCGDWLEILPTLTGVDAVGNFALGLGAIATLSLLLRLL